MSDSLKIVSNGRPRDVLSWVDLTETERAEFDYLDSDDERDGAHFARYRGAVYDLGQFTAAPKSLAPWDGVAPDTFFSATLARFVDHGESVIMGRCYS